MVSPREISSTPRSSNCRTTSRTCDGWMDPSKGQWIAVDTYPRTVMPSRFAPNTTGLNRSNDSLIVQLMFRLVNESEAAVKTAILFTAAALACSNPRSFGTSAE